jgi:L-ascorbate metabolism protein UlaG (beta-lactamase superfamily)
MSGSMRIAPRPLGGSLHDLLRQPQTGTLLAWLGQAGFLLRIEESVVLIDPYLSDHLAQKYRGTRFPHERMMPPPIAPEALPRVDLVICTHRHSDHMDPGTLPVIARHHPDCRFVVPAPEAHHAVSLGLPQAQVISAEAFVAIRPLGDLDLTLHPIPAAHETLDQDEDGRHRFLGFGLVAPCIRLYHSGDCIPYEGLVPALRRFAPDLGLLPVNGRDTERAAARIPGNFTLDEAIALCREAAIPYLIPHHFGMFAFNTLDASLVVAAAARTREPGLFCPDTRQILAFGPSA